MRPTRDEWALRLALLTAERSTCARRAVGAVLLNARGHVLSTGYNGVAAGLPHCNQIDMFDPIGLPFACCGACSPSGTNLDGCEAIHAEQNALLQCRDVYSIESCYVTTSPCLTCTKLLLNTSCQRIVFATPYAHDEVARDLWLRSSTSREWVHLTLPKEHV